MSDVGKERKRLDVLLTGLEDDVLQADEAGAGEVQARRAAIELLIEERAGATGRRSAAAMLLRTYLASSDSGRAVADRRGAHWSASEAEWRRFPIREIRKRGWFEPARGMDELSGLRAYFERAAGPRFEWALHRRRHVRGAKSSDEYGLLAWQFRILERARERMTQGRVPEFKPDERWLPALVALARRDDGVKRVPQFLEEKGVVLVIERHLPGTYLDGAAMLGDAERPVIGMTLRYDRLDNFWFVLFHELGHVFRHLRRGMAFFDDDEATSYDNVEREADRFALNNLISDEEWGRCLSRFSATEAAVRRDAERLGVHASIVAGRIRRELSDYSVLGGLVGQNMVRSQFGEATDDPG